MLLKHTHLFFFVAGLALITAASKAFAQEEKKTLDERYENWYQIELVIFDRAYFDKQAERWPANMTLLYPPRLNFLFSEEEWDIFINGPTEEPEPFTGDPLALEDTQISTADLGTVANPGPAYNELETHQKEASNIDTTINSPSSSTQSLNDELSTLPEMETPRIKLKSDELLLNSETRRLTQRPGYRVLFHEGWRQKLENTDKSTALLITGGEKFDAHYELEGSVKISLNRYLHIETNLWRTFFSPNYGQEGKYWPPIPEVPAPVSPIAQNELVSTEHLFTSSALDFDSTFNRSQSDIDLNTSQNESQFNFGSELTLKNEEAEAAHVVNEIFTLKQRRRMRSEELHYLDHPRLGVLVKITPYEVELNPEKIESGSVELGETLPN